MTPADLDRLDALAAAATPGPWWHARSINYRSVATLDPVQLIPGQGAQGEADAAYIAALSPDVVRELVADARLGAAWREAEAALPEVTDLAAIVARDAAWAEGALWQSRDGSDIWIDVPQLLADRRALLVLLADVRGRLADVHPHDRAPVICGACDVYNRLAALGPP